MAATRILRNLIRLSTTQSTQPRFITYRNQSSKCKGNPVEDDEQDLKSDSIDHHVIAVKRIELAMHQILIRKCSPGWLHFVPGSSYWVPSIGSSKSNCVAEMVEKLATSLKKEEIAARKGLELVRTERGWPSKAYFFKGASSHTMEMEINSNNKSQSEDEE